MVLNDQGVNLGPIVVVKKATSQLNLPKHFTLSLF